jgi:5-methylcytosine-specific restriction endonuclease McrA
MRGQRIPANLRAAVVHRAKARCEYCLVPDGAVMWPHEPDHVIAEQHGGQAELANLALACFHCNRRKGPVMGLVPGLVMLVRGSRRDKSAARHQWR